VDLFTSFTELSCQIFRMGTTYSKDEKLFLQQIGDRIRYLRTEACNFLRVNAQTCLPSLGLAQLQALRNVT